MDQFVQRKYSGVVEAALAKRLHHWQLQANTFVALIIVLDQVGAKLQEMQGIGEEPNGENRLSPLFGSFSFSP